MIDARGRLRRAALRLVALHTAPWARRIGYATASTLEGAVFFYLIGDVAKFPLGMLGFGVFLAGVFALSVVLNGRID